MRLKITELEKVRFIKVNELKLTQVEVAANASELFCMSHLANIERFSYPLLIFHFKYRILYPCKLARLRERKSTQVRE